MLKVLQLIFAPVATWTKIAEAQRGVLAVLVLNPLPLMILGSVLEALGLVKLGRAGGEFDQTKAILFPLDRILRYEGFQLVGDLVLLFVGAKMIQMLAQSSHSRARFSAAFAAFAYSMGPIFLARALDGLPFLNTWLCWSVGALLALNVLYHGVGMVLRPDQTSGFGLFLLSALVLLFLSGLEHFLADAVLRGQLRV